MILRQVLGVPKKMQRSGFALQKFCLSLSGEVNVKKWRNVQNYNILLILLMLLPPTYSRVFF